MPSRKQIHEMLTVLAAEYEPKQKSEHKAGERFEGEVNPNGEVNPSDGFSHFEYAGEYRCSCPDEWMDVCGAACYQAVEGVCTWDILIPVYHKHKVGDYVFWGTDKCLKVISMDYDTEMLHPEELNGVEWESWLHWYEVYPASPQDIRSFLTKKYVVKLGEVGRIYFQVRGGIGAINPYNGCSWDIPSTEQALVTRANVPIMSVEEYKLWKGGE